MKRQLLDSISVRMATDKESHILSDWLDLPDYIRYRGHSQ